MNNDKEVPKRNIPTRNVVHEKPNDDDFGQSNVMNKSNEEIAYDIQAEKKLTTFVEEQIEKMRAYSKLGNGNGTVSFFEVNAALMSYQDTLLALLSLHHLAKNENTRAKEAYDEWFGEKYLLIREDVNPRSVSSMKWYSTKEVEMMVRNQYRDKYKELIWNLNLTETQLSFVRRLLEGWKAHQFVITQLSKNLIAEVAGLGTEGQTS